MALFASISSADTHPAFAAQALEAMLRRRGELGQNVVGVSVTQVGDVPAVEVLALRPEDVSLPRSMRIEGVPIVLRRSGPVSAYGRAPSVGRPIDEQSPVGSALGRDGGLRTWRFHHFEDALLIPNAALRSTWPDDVELRMAILRHDLGTGAYGPGTALPNGVYTVVVFTGGVPTVLPDKLQVLAPGEMVLDQDANGPFWTLNGEPMWRQAPTRGQVSTWVWPGSRHQVP